MTFCVEQVSSKAMAESSSVSPLGGITPMQQMLASGTGALFTSLFGKCPAFIVQSLWADWDGLDACAKVA